MRKPYLLITGATGFIGSHVVDKIISDGRYHIVAVVRDTADKKKVEALKQSEIKIVKGNFYRKTVVESIFMQFPIQYVIHIAALRGGGAGKDQDYRKVNIEGTELLLQLSHKYRIKKFIFMSSVGVYGTIPQEVPAKLNTRLAGDNSYHKSKIVAETAVRKFIGEGLDAYIIRPTITYGAGDDGFPNTLINLVRLRWFVLPCRDIKIHLLDVSYLTNILTTLLVSRKVEQRIFLVADATPISLKSLVDLIYFHYNGKRYPTILRMPNFVYSILSMIFALLKNEKWLVRIKLISNSWYYENNFTERLLM